MQAKWVLFVNGGVHLPVQTERSRGMKANKDIHLVSGHQSLMLLRCFRSMRAALRRLPVKKLQGENAPSDVLILKFIVYALSAAGRNDSKPSNGWILKIRNVLWVFYFFGFPFLNRKKKGIVIFFHSASRYCYISDISKNMRSYRI